MCVGGRYGHLERFKDSDERMLQAASLWREWGVRSIATPPRPIIRHVEAEQHGMRYDPPAGDRAAMLMRDFRLEGPVE